MRFLYPSKWEAYTTVRWLSQPCRSQIRQGSLPEALWISTTFSPLVTLQWPNVCVCVCIKTTGRDFPGGPVVQTPGFHYRRPRLNTWSGKFHMPLGEARKQTPHCAYTKLHAQSLSCVQLFATPCSSVYGISQARILEWGANPFSRASFQPRDRTQVSCIAGRYFTSWATRAFRGIAIP